MTTLAQKTCEPCSGNAIPLTYSACQPHLAALSEWQIVDHDGIMKLTRQFTFRNFADALAFTQRVGDIAEQAGHHPVIVTEWGKTTVTWWSHAIKGLHLNDFILAARTDEVAE
ncbi:MAG: 4a-hydroxytetrahydrobiopterin dehydratase [Vreelandella alkaliphila]|uniref:Putative pterin-4-alpha-carbinolamine dehydratase n=1 Tax=Halomonas campaniensis TaxID=213554 RepID=A0A3D0KJQ6_9GAMM|nr:MULTISPECIES: 4a-hydroxytetrahydrobiopterin dehydratase [unclassified Halomonas]ASK18788.1 4a-hydroxytetrahydrobiopterin dehydratase [Halomonas sp. N3-2A]UTD54665.1 4a-hydroxytetrahydrobiopterin dehydratase [Halomonas sp. MS1]HBS82562.1 4a-hydroxytetrahydrobiopterin dehydratase [Halomonas campaniensis]HCA03399.1 4a-hydroxytetrahydrobiopterin dehydratase [Halomonas campaniensis]